ncbi:1,2-dihydroxy-3-keto-5-methylthiopentene dioxygenase 2-like isoform X2 [Dendrobium catenatum]|uniref:1,2-dihydroxy-3-keto-5-methylthiopentene dioxygenase 2-like isoform X2 n=1 Tax=Dendrobium catenatum TaxID=906689 RepID=UPI00109F6F16|nr:1,2-dihydroxy-3-keto-5-methylthiopentene dioxygenase 2-like isoform X2 [Dendrobium catenatum]
MAASASKYDDNNHDAMEAWYMDESIEDHRLPHHLEPKVFVSSDQLKELGVLSWQLKEEEDEVNEDLKNFCAAKGYTQQVVIEVSPEKLPNYEINVKKFFKEHLHDKEETHYIAEGSDMALLLLVGYFDVRDKRDCWIRIATKKGCIIALPAGIYHRFSLDRTNYIKAVRLFSVGEPFLTAYERPNEDLRVRKEYVEALMKKAHVDGHEAEAL